MDSFVIKSPKKKRKTRHDDDDDDGARNNIINKNDDNADQNDEKEILVACNPESNITAKDQEQRSDPQTTRTKKKNAFDLLMSSPTQQLHRKRQQTTASNASLFNTTANTTSKQDETMSPHKSTTNTIGSSGSRFVECPICHNHILDANISLHLDTSCAGMSKNNIDVPAPKMPPSKQHHQQNSGRKNTKENINHDNRDHFSAVLHEKPISNSNNDVDNKNKNTSGDPASSIPEIAPKSNSNDDTIFDHLMKQSRLKSSQQHESNKAKEERFHLHQDGTLTWTTTPKSTKNDEKEMKDLMINNLPVDVQWSSNVNIRDGRTKTSVVVSSSLPSSSSRMRLVQRHSRLSVPVLKSLLQKSIRRRKPLPSVRIACELIDKSWNEFIRRFPIIVLEDSFLNHDYDLLVWLMVASSKDYIPPMSIIQHVLFIVYEVAACPWRDDCDKLITQSSTSRSITNPETKQKEEPFEDRQDERTSEVSRPSQQQLTDKNIVETEVILSKNEVWIKSMHIRKCYGGMLCDMKMMQKYVDLWGKRLFCWKHVILPSSMATSTDRVILTADSTIMENCYKRENLSSPPPAPPSTTTAVCLWSDIPTLLHQKSKEQSHRHLSPIFTRIKQGQYAVTQLAVSDVCLAGVDFHCTSILNDILQDDRFYDVLCKALEFTMPTFLKDNVGSSQENGGISFAMKNKQRREFIINTVKSCMWEYSSSLNYKVILMEQTNSQENDREHRENTASRKDDSGAKENPEVPNDIESGTLKERAMLSVWEKHIRPCVDDYARKYLYDRLSIIY